MAVLMIVLILFGLQMLPEAISAMYAPYVYGAVLVTAFWMLRTQVRKLALARC